MPLLHLSSPGSILVEVLLCLFCPDVYGDPSRVFAHSSPEPTPRPQLVGEIGPVGVSSLGTWNCEPGARAAFLLWGYACRGMRHMSWKWGHCGCHPGLGKSRSPASLPDSPFPCSTLFCSQHHGG